MNFLKKPYPFTCEIKSVVIISFLVGIFVSIFLLVFKPFNGQLVQVDYSLYNASTYGVIALISTFIMGYIVPTALPRIYNEDNWTVGKEIAHIILVLTVISVTNFYVTCLFLIEGGPGSAMTITNLGSALIYTYTVGIFPVLGLVAFNYTRLLKKNNLLAEQINNCLTPSLEQKEITITITGQGKNELLELRHEQILYVKASSNYSEVTYLENELTTKKLLRNTLNNIQEQLQNFEKLHRVHRGYIVNLDKVINVHGNAQGYKLELSHDTTPIPVSRQRSNEVKQIITI